MKVTADRAVVWARRILEEPVRIAVVTRTQVTAYDQQYRLIIWFGSEDVCLLQADDLTNPQGEVDVILGSDTPEDAERILKSLEGRIQEHRTTTEP